VDYGDWDGPTKKRLEELRENLKLFSDCIREPRDRIISHNDLAVALKGEELGGFEDGADGKYFRNLQEFVDVVNGGPYPFMTNSFLDYELARDILAKSLADKPVG
jgi:hypothetical protein